MINGIVEVGHIPELVCQPTPPIPEWSPTLFVSRVPGNALEPVFQAAVKGTLQRHERSGHRFEPLLASSSFCMCSISL